MIKNLSLFIIFIFFTGHVYAATYYVDCDAADDTGTGAEISPKKYIQSGMALMSGGDTLIIEDGTYTGASNIIDYSVQQMPSGNYGVDETDRTADDVWTTIQARNYGNVTIDGEAVRLPADIRNVDYIHIDGIIFYNSSGTVFYMIGGTSSIDHGNVKITRCGFVEAADTTDAEHRYNLFMTRYTEYGLLQDCYFFGSGKYRQYILDSRYWILRRSVDRIDRCVTSEDNNSGSIRIYNSHHCIAQNCIVIDSDQQSQYFISGGSTFSAPSLFFIDGPDGTDDSHNQFLGCIGINNDYCDLLFHGDDTGNNDIIENSFFSDLLDGIWTRDSDDVLTIKNSVVSNSATRGAVYSDFITMGDVYNSIFYDNYVARNNFQGSNTDYNCYYNNTTNFSANASEQDNEITDVNPLSTSLLYPTKIESATSLSGAGLSGNDIGPTIIKQIGKTDTMYGQTGWDLLQNGTNGQADVDLWPFPNEDLIKEKMAAYTYDDGSGGDPEITGARGFCATTANPRTNTGVITLTSYIWEYLGNEIPSDIYGVPATINCSIH